MGGGGESEDPGLWGLQYGGVNPWLEKPKAILGQECRDSVRYKPRDMHTLQNKLQKESNKVSLVDFGKA